MFRDRIDAATRLAAEMRGRVFRDPLVLAIPRGGVVTGGVLAQQLGASLDIVLSRKLGAPWQPELAVGAVSETGEVYLNPSARGVPGVTKEYIAEQRDRELREIERRQRLFRAVLPRAPVAGRSVIVTDDGIATGSTMLAALQMLKPQGAHELIVAVPVAPPDRLAALERWCDDVVCLLSPASFWAIGEFYEDFSPVEDEEVVAILREFAAAPLTRAKNK